MFDIEKKNSPSAAHLDSYMSGVYRIGFRCGPAGGPGIRNGHSGGPNTVVSILSVSISVLTHFVVG